LNKLGLKRGVLCYTDSQHDVHNTFFLNFVSSVLCNIVHVKSSYYANISCNVS